VNLTESAAALLKELNLVGLARQPPPIYSKAADRLNHRNASTRRRTRLPLLNRRCFSFILFTGVFGHQHLRRAIMAMQIVMDRTGDSRHSFDPNDAEELAKAERRFYELTKVGFTAAVRTGQGQVSQIRSFDPSAEETVFFPRLVGG